MKIRARVFAKDDNRFLIPGYWCNEEDENWPGMSISTILCEGMLLGVVSGLDNEQEWLEIEARENGTGSLPHVPYRLTSGRFANGGIDIMLISGPLFDEATIEKAA